MNLIWLLTVMMGEMLLDGTWDNSSTKRLLAPSNGGPGAAVNPVVRHPECAPA
jgi:hypothetical protein